MKTVKIIRFKNGAEIKILTDGNLFFFIARNEEAKQMHGDSNGLKTITEAIDAACCAIGDN